MGSNAPVRSGRSASIPSKPSPTASSERLQERGEKEIFELSHRRSADARTSRYRSGGLRSLRFSVPLVQRYQRVHGGARRVVKERKGLSAARGKPLIRARKGISRVGRRLAGATRSALSAHGLPPWRAKPPEAPVPTPWSARCWCAMGKSSALAFINLPAATTPKSSRSKTPVRKAKGATLYINLEPCNHYGRTPPCTARLIRAGIKEVVAGMKDPNPLVAGSGFEQLTPGGHQSSHRCSAKTECRALNEAFAKFITRGVPFVTLKLAASLDGKIATASGDARWISGEESRAHGASLAQSATMRCWWERAR